MSGAASAFRRALDRAVTLGLGALFAMVVWKLYERRTGFG